MKLIREHIGFERGQDPKMTMDIGLKSQIRNWLDEYNIKRYFIHDDFTITVNYDVNLNSAGLMEFPSFIQFKEVRGELHINWNNLKNFKGCPKIVYNDVYANGNPFTSLEGIPEKIYGNFNIAEVCGFTENQIREHCNVSQEVCLTRAVGEETFALLQKVRPRHILR